ncbi:MAG: hypothetical protein A2158_00600 [Chloroflexi bacterium RBG_13_46_14]|nr:MAG: hypothetical protein A2158_00600 [Chloroflexi bacterium RBG_13_46_14]
MVIKTESQISPRKSLGFYTSNEASRIALVPRWTLYNWKQSGIIIPTVKWTDEFNKEHLGHTFETVVFMRLLRLLRNKGISLFKTVNALQQLKERFGSPGKRWADARLFVDKQDVFVYEKKDKDNWGTTVATRYNQRVAEFIFGDEFILLKDRADALLIPSEFMDFVEINPSIQNGLPIVLGTKILTSMIHNLKSQQYNDNSIRQMYPFISLDKVRGAEKYEIYLDKATLN